MHAEVVRRLRCPLCSAALTSSAATLRCQTGHAFDVARQGYVNLLPGRPPAGADSADMVAARADLLGSGLFDFLTRAVVAAAVRAVAALPEDGDAGLVLDVGAGTGHYLAAVLDALPNRYGLALDVAKPAARRAARAHARSAAAVGDVWRGVPLVDRCADLVLDVFAPRNAAEFHRVLRPTGRLIVVTAGPRHLAELIASLGLLAVDPAKEQRLDMALGSRFQLDRVVDLHRRWELGPESAARLVQMGPSAWHVDLDDVARRLAILPAPMPVTAEVVLRSYRPRQ